ncbi:hypothetical protein [Cupriavidus nantongensis]|uniref:Uncharacterized protein n=1 Tax=Cupriavidus nantongensis TaxID=1796606 RepID=A0A142JW47_9BURK|nr:hypothetical protein [Cupriavidus nantongensis]AMR82309.1 hypothetical protein A2G96_21600 [Cupriavidus nantongensis]
MATANVPFSSTPHAAALARILHVTRCAWALDLQTPQTSTPALSRRARLARSAARAFEAQVMAIRCRQAVVA